MRKFLFFIASLIAIITFSCDSTDSGFDETVPDFFTLTSNVSPQGGGVVRPSGGEFVQNSTITITAEPAEGFIFERWGGDLTGNTNPDTLVFSSNKSVTAFFTELEFPLNITIIGEGTVTEELINEESVEGSPPAEASPQSSQIESTNDTRNAFDKAISDTGSVNLDAQIIDRQKNKKAEPSSQTIISTIRLTATPDEGWFFDRWEGDITGSENPVEIVVDEEKNVTAVFEEVEIQEFTLDVQIQGEGTVDVEPDLDVYTEGDEVILTANASPEWEFIEWLGDLTGSENPATIVMDENKAIVARFEKPGASVLSITQQPSETTAGTVISPAPEVDFIDGFGNPVSGSDITVTLNNNAFTATSTTTVSTDENGVALFDNLSIQTAAAGYKLTFSTNNPDVTDITSEAFDVIAAAAVPANSTAEVPDGVAGETTTITISLFDEFDNSVSGAAEELLADVSGANTAQPSVTESDTPGQYTASYSPSNSGVDQIEITLSGTPINGSPFTSTVTTSDVSSANSTVTAEPLELVAGNSTVVTITLRDNLDNTVSGLAETIALNDLGNAEAGNVTEDGNSGIYMVTITNNTAEEITITVVADGVTLSDTPSITFLPDAAATAELVSGNNQTAPVGQTLAEPFVVSVTDQFGNPVEGQTVDFSISESPDGASGQSLSQKQVATNASGEASALLTLGDTPGSYGVDAAVAGIVTPVSFTATAQLGQPSQMVITRQPSETTAGQAISPAPGVEITDDQGNPIEGIGVSVTLNGAAFTAASTTSTATGSDGTAAFDNLVIESAGTGYTITFSASASGLTDINSVSFDVTTAQALASNTSAIVPNGVAGETTQITITVLDTFDNPVSGAETQLSITLSGANSAATPAAAETATAGEYTASYTPTNAGTDNIAITLNGSPISGSPFTSEVITSDISPANSTVTVDPATLPAGNSSTVTVLLRDGSNNPISGLTDSDFAVAVTGNAGAGSVSETSTGTYQFIVTDNTSEQVTVSVTATGVDLPDLTITFEAADADLMIITPQPAETVAGESINGPPSVRITDVFGNRVEGFAVTVSEQSGQEFSGGTLTVQTNSSGNAVFSDLTITETGNYNIVFSGSGIDNVTSNLFAITPASPDASNTTAVVPNGSAGDPTPITITVEDSFGNRVEGVAAGLSVTIGGANSGASVQTITDDGNGVYSTSYTPTSIGIDDVTIQLNGTPISGSPFLSTVTTSTAANVEIEQEPLQTIAGQPIAGPPAVRVTDDLNNPVSGVEVSVSEQSGFSFNSGTLTVLTDINGSATFNDLVFNTAGTYTLVFNAVGVADNAISQAFSVTAAVGDPGESFATVPDGTAGETTAITITVEDAFGNRVENAASDLSVSVSGDNAGAAVEAITDDGNGIYSTGYTPSDAGTDQVSITLGGTGISGSPFTSQVSAGSIADYVISNIASPQTAGQAFTINITARDANGNTATGYSGTANLSTTAGSISPTTTNFSSGTASQSVSVTSTGSNRTITATDNINSGITDTSNGFDVVAGGVSATNSSVSASPTTLTVGNNSTVTVQLRDSNGNPIGGLTNSDFTINLTGDASRTSVSETTTTGTYRFTVSDNTAESVTVAVTANGVSITDTATITFNPGPADSFSFNTIASQTAGVDFSITITALDANGNTATGYSGTANLSTTAGSISPATTGSFTSGTVTLNVTLSEAGNGQTITATDGTITGTSNAFDVQSGGVSASQSTVNATSPHTANGADASTVTVDLNDSEGNPVSGADFTIDLGASNASAGTISEPSAGTYTFDVTNTTAESVTVAVTGNGVSITDTATITFNPGPADSFSFNTIASQTAGVDFSITITALDANGNTATGYSGTANLSTTAGSISPATTGSFTSGTVTLNVTHREAGNGQTNPATHGTNTGTTNAFDVPSGGVSASQSPVNATSPHTANGADASTVTVDLNDSEGNPVSGADFTIDLGASNASAGTISEPSAGTYTFDVTNTTAESVTVAVTGNGVSITDTATITFNPGPADSFSFNTIASQTAGVDFSITITALDANGNTATGYSGTANLSTTAGSISPATTGSFTSGTVTLNVTLSEAGNGQTITATDGTITGTSNAFDVQSGGVSASQSTVNATSPHTANGADASTVTVDLNDSEGNPVSGADFTIDLGASNASAGTISESSAGIYTFDVTNTTAESVTVAVTANGVSITDTAEITFTPGPADSFSFSTIASQTAGVDFSITITALDANNNTATGYSGTATLSTTAGDITPTSTTFSNGIANPSVSVSDAGNGQTITATDGTITGTSNAFDVTAASASSLEISSGNGQTGTISQPLDNPFVVLVTDAFGNPVQGESVNFSISGSPTGAAGQSLSATSVSTDDSGQASTILTLGDTTGDYSVDADAAGQTVTFTATAQ